MEELNLDQKAIQISENKLVLPNFQREYVWGDNSRQIGFLASILARIPLGNIIIFKDDKNKFACRKIGRKENLDSEQIPENEVNFLLDGQQRLTTLLLMFSNNLYKVGGKINFDNLLNKGLFNRFFIRLPKFDEQKFKTDIDYFGYLSLKFPFESIPNFCSNDIFDGENSEIIEIKSFTKDGEEWFNPKFEESSNHLITAKKQACYNSLIPCYWILNNSDTLGEMLKKYAQERSGYLYETYSVVKEGAPSSGKELLCRELKLTDEKNITKLTDEEFKNILEERAGKWAKKMEYYLRDCITRLKINSFEVTNEGTERAIDIYEALNKGGVELSTYDLIIARAAKKDTQNSFSEKIERTVKEYKNEKLLKQLAPNLSDWNSKDHLKTITKGVIDKGVITQFLNLLCIIEKCEVGKMRGSVKTNYCKEKEQLRLSPEEIIEGAEDSMESIIDALMYLNIKQGVYKLSCIHYKFSLLPIAYAFYVARKKGIDFSSNKDDAKFFFCMLNAWYKTAVFTDFYQTSQSTRVIEHISDIDDMLTNKKLPYYFSEGFDARKDMVLNVPFYNDYKMLTFQEPGYNLSKAIEVYITQYYFSLETGVYDILTNDNGVEIPLNAYSSDKKLAIHHFIPLYIEKELRTAIPKNTGDVRNDSSALINSPLNKVIISEDSNKKIGGLIPLKYFGKIPSGYLTRNDFEKDGYTNGSVDEMVSRDFLEKVYKYRYNHLRDRIRNDIDNSVKQMKSLSTEH